MARIVSTLEKAISAKNQQGEVICLSVQSINTTIENLISKNETKILNRSKSRH